MGRQAAHSSDLSWDTVSGHPHLVPADQVPEAGEGHAAQPHSVFGGKSVLSAPGGFSSYVPITQGQVRGVHTCPAQCWVVCGTQAAVSMGYGIVALSGVDRQPPS